MAGMDLIKSYLVGIGFHIDNSSFNETKNKMNDAEKTVKSFAKNNNSSVASMRTSVGDIGELTRVSMGAIAKIFPNMKGPLNEVMGHINLVKDVFNAFSKEIKKDMDETNGSFSKFQSKPQKKTNNSTTNKTKNKTKSLDDIPSFKPKNSAPKDTDVMPTLSPLKIPGGSKDIADASKALTTLSKTSSETGVALETLSTTGSGALSTLATSAIASGVAAGKAAVAVGVLITAFTLKGIANLAQQTLRYSMLARQLWTTTQNAKEVSMALKTMGVTMQDLWLSPQLLAQFNQLRKDSAELKLPDSFNKNIVIVQDLGFEFERLKQAGTLCFQWIGSVALQYLAGPLDTIKVWLHNFNDQFLKDIPGIAKVVGTAVGLISRVFLDLVEVIGMAGEGIGKVFNFLGKVFNAIPKPIKDALGIALVVLLAFCFPAQAAILGIILVVDDLMTAFKGGKSVTGGWVKDFIAGCAVIKKWIGDIIAPFVAFGKGVKDVFSDIGKWITTWIVDPIDAFIKKVEQAIAEVKKITKDVEGSPIGKAVSTVKNAVTNPLGTVEGGAGDALSFFKGIGTKIGSLTGQSSVNYAVPSNKTSNSSSSSVANSNNKTSNTNTFNVYGTSPTTTASTIGKTLTGIQTHNLQGAYK